MLEFKRRPLNLIYEGFLCLLLCISSEIELWTFLIIFTFELWELGELFLKIIFFELLIFRVIQIIECSFFLFLSLKQSLSCKNFLKLFLILFQFFFKRIIIFIFLNCSFGFWERFQNFWKFSQLFHFLFLFVFCSYFINWFHWIICVIPIQIFLVIIINLSLFSLKFCRFNIKLVIFKRCFFMCTRFFVYEFLFDSFLFVSFIYTFDLLKFFLFLHFLNFIKNFLDELLLSLGQRINLFITYIFQFVLYFLLCYMGSFIIPQFVQHW